MKYYYQHKKTWWSNGTKPKKWKMRIGKKLQKNNTKENIQEIGNWQ